MRIPRSRLLPKCKLRQSQPEYRAIPADFHFLLPTFLHFTLANHTVDHPAEAVGLEFPSRTLPFHVLCAAFDIPTRTPLFLLGRFHGSQKKHLPLHVVRNASPTLLKTLDPLEGNAHEHRELLLRFSQTLPNPHKDFFIHDDVPNDSG